MFTARHAILDAFKRLETRTGRTDFRMADVVAEVQSVTNAFEEATLRTYIASVMCAEAPVHHANHTNDLRRVSRGIYKRATDVQEQASRPAQPPQSEPGPQPADPEREPVEQGTRAIPWYWEGHVQASTVTVLAADGWRILAVADTSSRSAGTDIIAERDGRRLHIEVKGYPTDTYARGPKAGQPKPTHPATQARVWFAGALLKASMLRGDHPNDDVAVAIPDFETYRALTKRVQPVLDAASIDVIWIPQQ